jgi:UDP-N-acetylglucosamine transferase subunit ALG13
MIFVTVGTNEAPFDRLIRVFEEGVPAAGDRAADEEVLLQHGASLLRPSGATCVDFLPFDDLVEAIRRARVVVMHAGVGSIMTALANGKRPVVVPRLRRYGEAVDDHQLDLGRRLHESGLVTLVEEPDGVPHALEHASVVSEHELGPSPELVAELRDFIVAERRRARGA